MNLQEVEKLLRLVVANDGRTTGEADAIIWTAALSDLPYDDCEAAVMKHVREGDSWLTPAMVRRSVKAIRRDRSERTFSCGVPGCGCKPLPPEIQRTNTLAIEKSMRKVFRRVQ